jgi:hypothetical protein
LAATNGVEGRMTHQDFRAGARTRLAGATIVALLSLAATPGRAAEAAERPYDPAVGSHWIIESETRTEDNRPNDARSSQINIRAELTIEAKTPDGFRITYVNRGATLEGNDPMLPMMRSAMKALQDVPLRATTDRTGKPVRIENLDEAKAAMRNMVGSLAEPFKDKPQVAAVVTQMVRALIEVGPDQAAEAYIDDVPLLAKAQNTGMKLHDIRRTSRAVDNPLGAAGTLKSSDVFEMTEADSTAGKRVFVNTTSYDMASMKDFMQSMSRKLTAAAGSNVKPAEIDNLIKSMVLTLDDRAVFEVEDGMTRRITGKTITTARAMGHNLQKVEEKTITVRRAP